MKNNNQTPVAEIISYYGNELPEIKCLEDEKIITHNHLIKDQKTGNTEMHNFLNHFSIEENHILNTLSDSIPLNLFIPLLKSASSIKPEGIAKGTYVTFLIIHYGIELNINNDKQLKLIYQPAIAIQDDPANDAKGFTIKSDPTCFRVFEKGKLNPISKGSAENLKNNYKQFIAIIHSEETASTPFINTDIDPKNNDSESALFPFQELFTLMFENNQHYDNPVKIYHAMNIRQEYNMKLKHGIILSPDYFHQLKFAGSRYLFKYANRAYLCPPDCSPITIEF
jgi:hypothetical protein